MAKLLYDIIGCGAVVQQFHAPILLYFKRKYNVCVRGCFDVNLQNARKLGQILNASVVGVPAELSRIETVSAAFIATPPDSHAKLIRMYVSKGKLVFVEKPFVTSAHDAKDLVTLARTNGTKILVGNFRRFYPSVRIAKKIIDSGGLGDVHRIEASEGMRWEWPTLSSYVVKSPFGGVIYDTGSHLLDMVFFVLSLDRENIDYQIDKIEKKPQQEPSHECRARITMHGTRFKNLRMDLRLSRVEPLAGIIKIYGKRGTLLIPTAFSQMPIFDSEDQNLFRKEIPDETIARDETGCFLLEHLELVHQLQARSTKPSVLDADNFISLIGLLESLANSAG